MFVVVLFLLDKLMVADKRQYSMYLADGAAVDVRDSWFIYMVILGSSSWRRVYFISWNRNSPKFDFIFSLHCYRAINWSDVGPQPLCEFAEDTTTLSGYRWCLLHRVIGVV